MTAGKNIDDGGPAFPRTGYDFNTVGQYGTVVPPTTPGMSLRDWFAGQALAGMLSNGFAPKVVNAPQDVKEWNYAKFAYTVADAMLAERSKP